MRICIDAGHGGKDPGAPSAIGEPHESGINLLVAYKLKALCLKYGHKVFTTRPNDDYIPLSSRSGFANRYNLDVFVSIHCNGAKNPNATGIETFHASASSKESKRLAKQVQEELMKMFPTHKNRGVKSAGFHVLRATDMPAILVEMEFISNKEMAMFLHLDSTQDKMAIAIFQGITGSSIVDKPVIMQPKKETILKYEVEQETFCDWIMAKLKKWVIKD